MYASLLYICKFCWCFCFLFSYKYDHDDMMIHLISLLEFEATDGMKMSQVCHRTGANLKKHFH